ncbi:hypothetical protein [Rhizobium sullae]|uniref:hypothetical protein n=1 Tax=Rhizobium sullae TaxID=50338 RepID=UPI0015C5C8CD|nr:hypothetical protein [Rhizobium sullae]
MDAGMDMTFPGGKANWRCDRVEIHCCTHPVEMIDCRQFKRRMFLVQGGQVAIGRKRGIHFKNLTLHME